MNGQAQALEKEEKREEAWPRLCGKKSQRAQKETGPRNLGAARTREGDPQEVQERISWEMGSSKKHAHWYKEGRKTCPISCLQPRKEGFGNK